MLPALIPILAQGAGSLAQIFGSGKNKRQRELEAMTNQTPTYSGGGGIMDFYNKALTRYSNNPYSSPLYAMQMQNAQRATNMGLNALNDRRSALAGVGKLSAIQNDATLRAGIAAENDQARRFGQLGQAAGMQGQEEKYRYNTNQLNPYLRKLQLAQQKAAGAAAVSSAGIQNMFGALSNASMLLGGGKNTPSAATETQGTNIPYLKRDAGIRPPSALEIMRKSRNVQDVPFEDIQDYNIMDRG
jgi:hypothetical protein